MRIQKCSRIAVIIIMFFLAGFEMYAQEVEILSSGQIKNVKNPQAPQDAATKAYVDMLEATIRNIVGKKDIDNNRCKTVNIGTQKWMAENLRVVHYNDGTPIPLVLDNIAWQDSSIAGNPAYTWYDNGISGTRDYGALYNWYAIDTLSNGNKNVCPIGWHVPTDAEWTILTDLLGGVSVAGGKMKETGLGNWNSPNTAASNESGFSGLPGGHRDDVDGMFYKTGTNAYWWSSTAENTSTAWNHNVFNYNGTVIRNNNNKGLGRSVRCLQD